LQHVASKMCPALDMKDAGPMPEHSRVHGRPVRLSDTTPARREEVVQDLPAAGGRELEHNRLLVRGVIAPEIRIARATSALWVQQFGKSLIDLHIAGTQDLRLQLLADRDQKVRGSIHIAAASL